MTSYPSCCLQFLVASGQVGHTQSGDIKMNAKPDSEVHLQASVGLLCMAVTYQQLSVLADLEHWGTGN